LRLRTVAPIYATVFRPLVLFFCFVAIVAGASAAKPEYPAMGPDIFEPKAPAEKLIAEAMVQAKRDDRKVLLLFGANWCPWCRRLHAALTENPAIQSRLRQKFVLVHLDANTRHDKQRNAVVLKKYGDPIQQFGLPVFVVLGCDGIQLTTRETASLAADTDQKTADRVLSFLDEWSR
jgi:thiol:disulfide interchange protein